jgi:hypothetical protein
VTISGPVCTVYQDNDFIWFSDEFAPQLPDGQTDIGRPDAVAVLTPVGGVVTENGITTTVQTFVVPKLPAGDYFLYAACNEASACCEPLEPTFRVLGIPDTSTYEPVRSDAGPQWIVLGVAFAVGLAMILTRSRSSVSRRGQSS